MSAERRRNFRDEMQGRPLELPDAGGPTIEEALECQRLGISLVELRTRRGQMRAERSRETRAALRGAKRDGGYEFGHIPGLDDADLMPALALAVGPITVGDPVVATRSGDRLELTLRTPPRTKKNSTHLGIKPSAAYSRFLLRSGELLTESMRQRLGLPLPAVAYNCAARFYVDNDRSDTVGLMQGLADVLEALGVVANDRWVWTWNGSDQFLDRDRPRVELTLERKGDR